ncbi:MAG TPA: sugar ABC transporter substrate-binding protein [Chloroflexota bacterium]|nr:sugar ABC transporter substrate-binding protein [Chloroflexota bacterium]
MQVTRTATRALRTRRHFVLSAGAIGAGTVAAACAPGSSPAGSGQASPSKVTGTPEFWQWGTVYNEPFETLVNEFNAQTPGVTVKFVPSSGGYWDKLTSALAGGDGPDVFLMNGVNAPSWAHRKQVRDLSDLVARDKAAANDLKAVVKAYAEFYQSNGKLMGWPWDFSASVTAFNVDHMREEGLKTPAELGDGWDWNALLEYGKRLTKSGGARWGVFSNSSIETGWLNYVVGNGGAFLTPDRKQCVIGSPQAQEATQFLVDLIHKHRVAPTPAELTDIGGATDGFISGRLSIGTYGDWTFSNFINKSQGAKWDVTFIAKSPKLKKTGNMTNFRGLVMNPATKQVEANWAFMTHLLTKPVQDRVPKLFNEVPARQDSADEVYANVEKAGPPDNRRLLRESIRATQPLPAHDVVTWTDMVAVYNPILQEIFTNQISVRDGLTKMQTEVNALFQRGGAGGS